MSAASPTGGGLWRVATTIAWRSLHTYVRRPDLFVPSLVFPLIFLASFAGGLSALGSVPGFHFPAGYTAFQFVFVLCQSAVFAGLFTGFSLAFDFETGFARRLMLAAEDRRGTVLGVLSGLDSLAGFMMPPLVTGVLEFAGVAPADAIVVALLVAALAIGEVFTALLIVFFVLIAALALAVVGLAAWRITAGPAERRIPAKKTSD